MQTGTLEITGLPLAILQSLAERAHAAGATAEEYARALIEQGLALETEQREAILPLHGQDEESDETAGERLERLGLIGMIDSSQPDPDSPPRHTEFGRLLAEKFRKQGLRIP